MVDNSTVSREAVDYRHSHLHKGTDYDEHLATSPISAYMAEREKEILSRIITRLFPVTIPRYLDFACGTGRITQLLERRADESFGLDISEKMVEQAKRKCSRTTFILGDATCEKQGIDPVNLVTAFRFFGNAQDELRLSALHTISSLLNDGGYLIFNNHRNPWAVRMLLLRLTGDRVREDLDFGKLKSLLSATGFKIVRTYGIGFWIFCSRLNRTEVLNSRLARLLETLSRLKFLGPFCPDAVIVARKRSRPLLA